MKVPASRAAFVDSPPLINEVMAGQIEKRVSEAELRALLETQGITVPEVLATIPADAPTRGPADAPVTVQVWLDFQCPFCRQVAPALDQLLEAYPNDVRLVFRNRPLSSIHPAAQLAAEAAMAANAQGKFWEYHDVLFANQRRLDRASLERYASELGLDMTAFKAALDQGTYTARVVDESRAAGQAGINGTPAIFVNGAELRGAQPFEVLAQAVEAALAAVEPQ
jgi:protein-disulfide isomerase